MRKILLLVFILSVSILIHAQINKIDHFNVSSPNAEKLFNFFREELSLPVVWNNKIKGRYASAAVWLGNVSLEFVTPRDTNKTRFDGIGLEPRQSAKKILPLLNSAKISHDSIQSYTFTTTNKNGLSEVISFSILSLENVLPNETDFFICDYKHREHFALDRTLAADSLKIINGGPLGIMFLREIVVGCKDLSLYKNELAKLPGIKEQKVNLFSFNSGPPIRLIRADSPGIKKIIIEVSSIYSAKKYLESKNLLDDSSRNSVSINPQAIDGLTIVLAEK